MVKKLIATALLSAAAIPMTANAAVLTCNTNSGRPAGGCNVFAPTVVGANADNPTAPGALQYFAEQSKIVGAALAGVLGANGIVVAATQAVASDYFNFNPANPGIGNTRAIGSATFGGKVIGIINTRTGLIATSATSAFGKTGVTYNAPAAVGTEAGDVVTFSGNSISFNITGSNPGDSFRVLTAVPEPSTWMMLLFGFGVAGFALRRRRDTQAVSFS